MESNLLQTSHIAKRRGSNVFFIIILLFGALLIGVTVIGLYLTGGLSFIRRVVDSKVCFSGSSAGCIPAFNISDSQPLPAGSEENPDLGSQLYVKTAVLAGVRQDILWVWAPGSLLKKHLLTDNTKYGVAAVVNQSKAETGKLASMLQVGTLEWAQVFPSFLSNPALEGKALVLENQSEKLTKEGFSKIAKSGNLLKIVYDVRSNEIIGAVLLDFRRL